MTAFLIFIISNFTLTFFVIGLIFTVLSLIFQGKPRLKSVYIHTTFSYFLLFNIGFSFLYNFIMHVFFGQIAAQFIGWSQSPFQLEVGFASLGFGIVGIISFWTEIGFRSAAIIGPSIFLWGAAGGHIYQMVMSNNFAPGNVGVIFWTDILIPILGLSLLALEYKNPRYKLGNKYNLGN